jgi:Calcineurin-like phosphoesterase
MRMRNLIAISSSIALLLCFHCTGSSASLPVDADADLAALPARNWTANPAIVQIDNADEIFALSDPHGGYIALGRLLAANRLITQFSEVGTDATKARWTGGTAVLVVAGDLIDKGADSLGVIDLLRSLQPQALAAGGRVVVTLGNHEAEFFADPKNKKAMSTGVDANGINSQLQSRGIKPSELARGRDAGGRGAWLLNLPFGVRIKKWFFAHGGNTDGESVAQLEKRLVRAVDSNGYGDKDIAGSNSILQAQDWYGNPDKDNTARKNAEALGVKHIAFGHEPGAFKDRGRILASKDGILVKLDVAMGLQASTLSGGAQLLHVRTVGTDSAEVLDARGRASPLLLP